MAEKGGGLLVNCLCKMLLWAIIPWVVYLVWPTKSSPNVTGRTEQKPAYGRYGYTSGFL